MFDYEKYKTSYLKRVKRWLDNDTCDKKHKIYEILWALHEKCILWEDVPPDFYNLPHMRDYGVDLISLDKSKAGQVKMYGSNSKITWKGISTFWQYAEKILQFITSNLWIYTTNEAIFDSMILQFKPNIKKAEFDELIENIKPDLQKLKIKPKKSKINIEVRDYMVECYNIITQEQKNIIKIQIPPGVGKSYIIYYTISELLKENKDYKFCIICPWRPLAKQLKTDFTHLGITNQMISGKGRCKNDVSVIICINNSSKYLQNIPFKYKFIDEAHHIENDGIFKNDIDSIKCDKEIQLTATFKNQDDIDFKMNFREAVEKGYITDYKLVIEYFTTNDQTKDDLLVDVIGKRQEWFPALIYFNTVYRAKMFCDKLKEIGLKAKCLTSENVNESENIKKEMENNQVDIVCLVGCWNEGISINNLKTVILGDMRYSYINRYQIITRADRLHADKPFYNIVIPICDENLYDNDDLSSFVKTLFEFDPKIKQSIDNKTTRIQIHDGKDSDGESDGGDGEDGESEDSKCIYIGEVILNSLGEMISGKNIWLEMIKSIEDYDKENGNLPPQKYIDLKGIKIGEWLQRQKRLHKQGKLKSEIETRLMLISSYKRWWDSEKSIRNDPYIMIKIISDYDKETGKLLSQSYIDLKGCKIGGWLQRQKDLHKKGKLNPEIEKGLMAIPSYKKWWNSEKPTKPEPVDPNKMIKIITDFNTIKIYC